LILLETWLLGPKHPHLEQINPYKQLKTRLLGIRAALTQERYRPLSPLIHYSRGRGIRIVKK
jgi:hypothetical protein